MKMDHARDFMGKITEDDLIEAEQDVLAAIIADNDLLNECGLDPSDFSEGPHQKIYSSIVRLYRGHQRANSVSLKPDMPQDFGGISSAQYLSKLQIRGANPNTRGNFEAALQIIKGASIGRLMAQEAQFLSSLAAEGHTLLTLNDELDQSENRIKEIKARFSDTRKIMPPGSAYLAAFQASARHDGVIGVPIALPEIATVLSEPVFEAGNLYGLVSSSGEGKSSLTLQIIYHAVAKGHPVFFASYDQSQAQCVRQMIAQEHGISAKQQRDPMRLMTSKQQDDCVRFATWLDQQPIEIRRCQREGVSQLVAHSRRFVKQYDNGKTPLIVIDHIGKVKPRDPKLSPDRISGEITSELKAFADEGTKAAVLILNQRNSYGMRRDNPRPISGDLYGGEGAKADYDAILYLYRQEKYKAERLATAATDADYRKINQVFGADVAGMAEIGSIKCRFGDPTIREQLTFVAEYTRYESIMPPRPPELDL